LIDIRIPEPWDGISLRKEIIKRWSRYSAIPFIAQTALATEEDKEDIIKAGFDSYITKPIDFKHLISVVFELLKEKKEFI